MFFNILWLDEGWRDIQPYLNDNGGWFKKCFIIIKTNVFQSDAFIRDLDKWWTSSSTQTCYVLPAMCVYLTNSEVGCRLTVIVDDWCYCYTIVQHRGYVSQELETAYRWCVEKQVVKVGATTRLAIITVSILKGHPITVILFVKRKVKCTVQCLSFSYMSSSIGFLHREYICSHYEVSKHHHISTKFNIITLLVWRVYDPLITTAHFSITWVTGWP